MAEEMLMSSRVSVIIPTYNGSAFIGEALESVWQQTHLPREIIVVDDASTDGTPELVRQLATRSLVPLRVIGLKDNSGGPAQPMNVGMTAATGEFGAILDQDDILAPDKLEAHVRVLDAEPDIDVVFSWWASLDAPAYPMLSPKRMRQLKRVSQKCPGYCRCSGRRCLRLLLGWEMFMGGFPGLTFRRRLWASKGGFDESLKIAADYDFACWASSQGDVAFVPAIGFWHRYHAQNACRSSRAVQLEATRVRTRYAARERDLCAAKARAQSACSWLLGMTQWFRGG
jgi:glycosyltransferase involved in cell wall biosynthesis